MQEPIRLFEAGSFDPAHPYVRAALEYLSTVFNEYFNSFGNEQGFCDIRDNERRGAKHTQRSDGTLHALAISSMATRWEASEVEYRPELVAVDPEDVASSSNVHVAPETYRTGGKRVTAESLGFDPGEISNPNTHWPATTVDRFSWAEVWGWGGAQARRESRAEPWPGETRTRAGAGKAGRDAAGRAGARQSQAARTVGGAEFFWGDLFSLRSSTRCSITRTEWCQSLGFLSAVCGARCTGHNIIALIW